MFVRVQYMDYTEQEENRHILFGVLGSRCSMLDCHVLKRFGIYDWYTGSSILI